MSERTVVIAAAVRTPMGRLGGQLSPVRVDDLAAAAISGRRSAFPR